MKKIALVVIALASNGVMAEWTEISQSGDAVLYLDSDTIVAHPERGSVTVKMMVDRLAHVPVKGHEGYSSELYLGEFSCAKMKVRTLSTAYLSERMGKGREVASSSKATAWSSVKPGSTYGSILKFTCKE